MKRLALLIIGTVILLLTSEGQSYNFYYGNLHSHTGYSDGNQDSATSGNSTPAQDYAYAKLSLHMDFLGISDHNHYQAGMKTPADYHSGVSQATTANDNGNFVCLYGMEWGVISGGGHVIVYGIDSLIGWDKQADGVTNDYDIFCAKNDYASLWNIVKTRPKAFCTLAHPNSGDYGNLLGTSFSSSADSAISGCAFRNGSAFSTTTNYSDPAATSYESYYKQLLAKGYHAAPEVDADNHNTTFGRTNEGRTVVLATVLNRDSLLSALKKRRYYGSDDWNVQVNFTVAGNYMGSIANSTVNPVISVNVVDADAGDNVSTIQIYYGVPGSGTIATVLTSVSNNSTLSYTHNISVGNAYYYYAKITQADGDIMITSPVWITKTPSNDDAPGAIQLTVGAGCSANPYSNASATQSTDEPFAACKGTAGYKTVWFRFVAPTSGAVKISTDYSGGTMGSDTRIALFSATNVNDYATFANIACDDDNGVIVPERSILYATGLTAGNTYYIQVDGKDASTAAGTFCLAVDEMNGAMISAVTGCSAGQSLTNVNDNYPGWLSATDANGNLIALIKNPSGLTTTSTYSISLNINAAAVRNDGAGRRYLDRNFYISNTSVANAIVRFIFLNAELSNLQAADPAVTITNLQVTKQSGNGCAADFVVANGTNTSIAQSANGSASGFSWIDVNTPGFSKFYLHTRKAFVANKIFIQGAYSSALGRLKDVLGGTPPATPNGWYAATLNSLALNQPYNVSPFNYAGTESVSPGFFTATVATTDPFDWVLIELRDAITPATVVARRAGFIREDGRVVDLDGVSDISFTNVANGNYFVTILHRNHLGVRSATTRAVDGTLGTTAPFYDFTTAQSQAYQDPAILSLAAPNNNPAMKDLGGGVFGMWGGNGNSNNTVRASGPLSVNDYLSLITTTLGGNVNNIQPNVYKAADINMDGSVRASGPLTQNDYLFLITIVLGGDVNKIITQHQ